MAIHSGWYRPFNTTDDFWAVTYSEEKSLTKAKNVDEARVRAKDGRENAIKTNGAAEIGDATKDEETIEKSGVDVDVKEEPTDEEVMGATTDKPAAAKTIAAFGKRDVDKGVQEKLKSVDGASRASSPAKASVPIPAVNGESKENKSDTFASTNTVPNAKPLLFRPTTTPYLTSTGKDLIVTLRVLPRLAKYFSSTRGGVKSRGWGGGHDGESLIIIAVEECESVRRARKGVPSRAPSKDVLKKSWSAASTRTEVVFIATNDQDKWCVFLDPCRGFSAF